MRKLPTSIPSTAAVKAKAVGSFNQYKLPMACEGWRPAKGGVLIVPEAYQATEPILKIGRYIAMTRPPITTPSTAMIIGSMRDDSALTASSTSSS